MITIVVATILGYVFGVNQISRGRPIIDSGSIYAGAMFEALAFGLTGFLIVILLKALGLNLP